MIVAAVLLVGLGLAGSLTDGEKRKTSSPLPAASAPIAQATPRATRVPTPIPTPAPTLAPMVAAITSAELAPTGALVADIGDPAVQNVVVDVNGTVWATGAGTIINVDPLTGRAGTWTLADDLVFATASLATARNGGVWLVTERSIRLFDGKRFSVVIDTPAPVSFMVEDANGALWAQADRYGLIRWTDGTWASAPPGRPVRGAAAIAVDAENRVWTVNLGPDDDQGGGWAARGISVWDGSAWTDIAAEDLPEIPAVGWSIPSLFSTENGDIWVALDHHLARFSAGGWTTYDIADLGSGVMLSAVGDDGRLWFVRQDCQWCGVHIEMYDGSALTTYDEGDGLPAPDAVDWPGAAVLPGPGFVLAATGAGLYALAGGSWQRLGSSAPTAAAPRGLSPPGDVPALAASSGRELWVTSSGAARRGNGGLFRYDGSDWRRQQLPVETAVGPVTVGPPGTLWVATSDGPLVRRGGAWADLGEVLAQVVPEPGQAIVGCPGVVFTGAGGIVYYAGPRSANRLVAMQPAGSTYGATLLPASPVNLACSETFAATADGTVWRLRPGWSHSLWRSKEAEWQEVSLPPMDGSDPYANPSAIMAGRDGSVWVAVNFWDPAANRSRAAVMQLVAGQWVQRGDADGMQAVDALALLPDGSLVAVGDGVATFNGLGWHQRWPGLSLSAVSVALDGAVWVAGANVYRLPPMHP